MKEVHKVNKATARKLFRKGVRIYVLPCKVRYDNPWIQPFLLQKTNTFDRIVLEYEFYNCNAELGYYCSYYAEKKGVRIMKNVTVNKKKYGVNGDTPVKLNNGGLVLHYNKVGDILGAYLITSFRDSNGRYKGDQTSTYCSLVDLDNGYLKFEERCSRVTTVERVLSHLCNGKYYGEKAVKEGQYIKVYKSGEFSIDIAINEEEDN